MKYSTSSKRTVRHVPLQFVIVRKRPIPPKTLHFRTVRVKWPWEEMKVGNSFEAPYRYYNRLGAAAAYRKRTTGEAYCIRRVGNKVVIWRIE
jgi:hypothetical protein